ncbi:MAG: GntR family transcriptional regulator [Ilumatobacteraceae bacterium]
MTSPRRPDRNSPLPLWAQVLDDLRRRLAAGEFADGFPADRELTDEYGVSRHTARDAVRRLQEAGLLQRERGRGTFLRPDAIEQGTGVLYSLFQSVEDAGYEQRSDVRALEVTHDAQAALRLDLPDDAELIRLERVRFIDRDPVAHDELFLPAGLARDLLDADFERTALYIELERRCGIRPEHGSERIRPDVADGVTAALLDTAVGAPLFVVERDTFARGRPLEIRRTIIRGDRYTFVTNWGRAGESSGTFGAIRRSDPA